MKLESQITNIEAQRKSRLFGNHSSLIDNQSKKRSTPVENVRQINPFYAKQTQFYAFFTGKRRFHQKTNPIQTQFNPIQSQFKPNFKPQITVSCLLFSDAAQILVKCIYSGCTKTPSKTDGNDIDIYTMLYQYIQYLICFLTSEVVRRLKLKVQQNE